MKARTSRRRRKVPGSSRTGSARKMERREGVITRMNRHFSRLQDGETSDISLQDSGSKSSRDRSLSTSSNNEVMNRAGDAGIIDLDEFNPDEIDRFQTEDKDETLSGDVNSYALKGKLENEMEKNEISYSSEKSSISENSKDFHGKAEYQANLDSKMASFGDADIDLLSTPPQTPPRTPPEATVPLPGSGVKRRRLSRGDILQELDAEPTGSSLRHNVLDTGTSMYSGKPDLLSLLDEYFDITEDRLAAIFDSMDKDEDGVVSYEAFREALRDMGIEGSDASFSRLVKTVDSDKSGGITFEEFARVVQHLKLLDLFDTGRDEDEGEIVEDDCSMRGTELCLTLYSKEHIRFVDPETFVGKAENLRSFFFKRQPSWAHVCWVHMRGLDALMMERLAVKYRLHPLAVEDALNVEQRPKMEKYQGHLFMVIPIVSASLRRTRKKKSGSLITCALSVCSIPSIILDLLLCICCCDVRSVKRRRDRRRKRVNANRRHRRIREMTADNKFSSPYYSGFGHNHATGRGRGPGYAKNLENVLSQTWAKEGEKNRMAAAASISPTNSRSNVTFSSMEKGEPIQNENVENAKEVAANDDFNVKVAPQVWGNPLSSKADIGFHYQKLDDTTRPQSMHMRRHNESGWARRSVGGGRRRRVSLSISTPSRGRKLSSSSSSSSSSDDEGHFENAFELFGESTSLRRKRNRKKRSKKIGGLRLTREQKQRKMQDEAAELLDDYHLHLNTSQLSIFCIGTKTLLSIHDNPYVHSDDFFDIDRKLQDGKHSPKVSRTEKWVNRLGRRLRIRNSKLRHGDAYFLLYTLLDACVDQYFPVVEAFSRRILLMERQLVNNPRDEFDINGVNKVKRQLEMLHRLLRPVREVVRHCIDDMESIDTTFASKDTKMELRQRVSTVVYLRDVYDHLQQVLDDCITSIEACRSINDQSAQLRDMKMNEVMYFLTLVTTLFVPAEFLTGVYGMNFMDKDNKPTIPELLWPHGYALFWAFFGFSVLMTLLYFRRRGWV